jgi:hypothetical protein
MAQQQGLGQLDVVAAAHPDAGAQQRGIALRGGRPEPARVLGGLPGRDRGGQVGDRARLPRGAAVRVHVLPAAGPVPAPVVGHHRYQHDPILPAGYDILPAPGLNPGSLTLSAVRIKRRVIGYHAVRQRPGTRKRRPTIRAGRRSPRGNYLVAPAVRPDWIWRWKNAYTMIIGRIERVRAANSAAQLAW